MQRKMENEEEGIFTRGLLVNFGQVSVQHKLRMTTLIDNVTVSEDGTVGLYVLHL